MLDHMLAVLPGFLLACVALAALPGPATALFIHRTVRDGRRAGLAAEARELMQDEGYVREAREVAALMEQLRGPW